MIKKQLVKLFHMNRSFCKKEKYFNDENSTRLDFKQFYRKTITSLLFIAKSMNEIMISTFYMFFYGTLDTQCSI